MLSKTLQALADSFHRFGDSSGVILTPEAAATYGRVLTDLAEQAEVLEEATANAFSVHGLPADIVKIATLLSLHGVSAGMPAGRVPQ